MSRDKNGRFAAGGESERRRQWVGERFGRLVVTGVEYGVQCGKKKRTMCACKCDCGNEIRTVSEYLVAGKTSCGCDTNMKRRDANRIDLTGKRFGRLVVEEMIWGKPHTKCRCKCDCGNETIVINTGLTSGKTQSCGCYQRDRASEANTEDFSGCVTKNGIRFLKKYKQDNRGVWIWECKCPICNNVFYGIPAKIVYANTMSCGCIGGQYSTGEETIRSILEDSSVRYIRQFMFDDCNYKKQLRFDFAIVNAYGDPIHLIEYDGIQHFKPIDFFGGEKTFLENKKRDRIKDEYCNTHNIKLTRLPYTMSEKEMVEIIESIINP